MQILRTLPIEFVDCCITSPPYFNVRDYKIAGQLGHESTVSEYISKLIAVFDEVKRVLKPEGSLWVVIADCYNKNKCLACIPERFAISMTNSGWILRNKIIYQKPNVIPNSIKNRFTIDFENVFWFVKSQKYYFQTQYEPYSTSSTKYKLGMWHKFGGNKRSDGANRTYSGQQRFINPRGRIKRCVWSIPASKYPGPHFAVFSERLIEIPIKATCPPESGIVLDCFSGTGVTALAALKNQRRFIAIELNGDYCKLAEERIRPYVLQRSIPEYVSM